MTVHPIVSIISNPEDDEMDDEIPIIATPVTPSLPIIQNATIVLEDQREEYVPNIKPIICYQCIAFTVVFIFVILLVEFLQR